MDGHHDNGYRKLKILLVAVTLLASGVINGFEPTLKITVATALASGFSERFVLSAINAFTKSS
jgi:hypothetical protein